MVVGSIPDPLYIFPPWHFCSYWINDKPWNILYFESTTQTTLHPPDQSCFRAVVVGYVLSIRVLDSTSPWGLNQSQHWRRQLHLAAPFVRVVAITLLSYSWLTLLSLHGNMNHTFKNTNWYIRLSPGRCFVRFCIFALWFLSRRTWNKAAVTALSPC